jgi:hypothetical protein
MQENSDFIVHLIHLICVHRRGFASHSASCAYPHSRRMMGSICSAGSHLGMPPLASNGLRPTNRAPGFVFCAWMAMHAPRVLESFHIVFWKVSKSSTDFGKLPWSVLESFQKLNLPHDLTLVLFCFGGLEMCTSQVPLISQGTNANGETSLNWRFTV